MQRRVFLYPMVAIVAAIIISVMIPSEDSAPSIPPPVKPVLVASTTLLGTALSELSGDWADVRIIVPYNSCPATYDMKPSDAQSVERASLIIAHAFQTMLMQKMDVAGDRVVKIETEPWTLPENFLTIIETTAEALSKSFPDHKESIDRRVAQAREILAGKGASLQQQLTQAGLVPAQTPVVCAKQQEGFLRMLGFKIAAAVDDSGDASLKAVSDIVNTAKAAGARLVAANLPSGTAVSELVTKELDAPLVVLDNFPKEFKDGLKDYLAFLDENVELLIAAVSPTVQK